MPKTLFIYYRLYSSHLTEIHHACGPLAMIVIVLVFKSRALVRRIITVLMGVMSSASNHIISILTLLGNRGTCKYWIIGR